MRQNPNFQKLAPTYLFSEIRQKTEAFKANHPEQNLLYLSVGDTSQPLVPSIAKAMAQKAEHLATIDGYRGYGAEQGEDTLRASIAQKLYQGRIQREEIFISDGAKCDLGRLQMLFGDISIAFIDPSYPVYHDAAVLCQNSQPIALDCTPENDFWPDLEKAAGADALFFCSPNNPTGKVANRGELTSLVEFALKGQKLIVFDVAYADYIQGNDLPRSIYEIEGATKVAIEVGSFSKSAGFSGVRLGYTVVPKALRYSNNGSVHADYNRLTTTLFNGASSLAQSGAIAALSNEGRMATLAQVHYYLENAALLKKTLRDCGFTVFGGTHVPYLWVKTPSNDSWGTFNEFLTRWGIVTTPGIGFGAAGEGFVRFSSLSSRAVILQAIERMKQ